LGLEDNSTKKAVLYNPEKEEIPNQPMSWSFYPTGDAYSF
jgi:hypothetical protein